MAGDLLYRRGNFNGTMDQLICDALRHELDAELALSPGFRWGNTMLPGEPITMGDVLSETAITYPEVYVQEMTGAQIKSIMEDICDNLFNPDPYYQQGGDMVRIGGLDYACAPGESVGKRISDLTLDSGKHARSRQELQGRRLGFGQSANRQAGRRSVREISARDEDRAAEKAQPRGAQGRGEQPGNFRVEDAMVLRLLTVLSTMVALMAPAAAQTPAADKPFAEHHIVLQLSDRDADKQLLVLSIAYNLLAAYNPDKIAIEVVTFGPGIDLLRAKNPNRVRVDSLISQGVVFDICMNTVDTLEREGRARRHQSRRPCACRSASAAFWNWLKRATPSFVHEPGRVR